MTVRDLLSQGRMDGNTLEYVRETGFTNAAAPVAEGALKPDSDLKFDLVNTSAKVIAHWMKASRQILSDFAQLRSVIDNRLLYGLANLFHPRMLWLMLWPMLVALALPAGASAVEATRGLQPMDLATLDRYSSPTLSPDGRLLVLAKRVVDYDANKASSSLWIENLLARDAAKRVAYVSSERFTNDLIASIQEGRMADFRRRFWVCLVLTVPVLLLSPTTSGQSGSCCGIR